MLRVFLSTFCSLSLFATACIASGQAVRPTQTGSLSEISDRLARGFEPSGAGFVARQPDRFSAEISTTGALKLTANAASLAIRTVAYGSGANRVATSAPQLGRGVDDAGWPRLNLARPNFNEWFVNERAGMHHWMQVQSKPGIGQNLWVKLAVSGATGLQQIDEETVELKTATATFSYAGLSVWDANGTILPAHIETANDAMYVVVDDQNAQYPVTIDPVWTQQTKLIASDGANSDQFGFSVSVSGDLAVIGAPYANLTGSDLGAAYVFRRSGASWTQEAKLSASDGANGDYFGYSVGISGSTVVVGAYGDAGGSAYVFVRNGTSWSQQQKLVGSGLGSSDQFGSAVAISGNSIVVGARNADPGGSNRGAGFVFVRNGSTWTQEARLLASDGRNSDQLGYSVGISGDRVVLGAYGADAGASNGGAAYVYERSGSTWTQALKFVAPDAGINDRLGFSSSISGDTFITGARFADAGGTDRGAAYVVSKATGSWVMQAKLTASSATNGDNFGFAVSISGDLALVGAYSSDIGGSNRGAAYSYTRTAGTWGAESLILGADNANGNQFGCSVSVDGETALVGARLADPGGSNRGAAYTFAVYRTMAISFANQGVTTGKVATGTVTISSASATDTVISLTSSTPALTLPSTVTVPAGSTSATFIATAGSVNSDTTATITGSATAFTSGTGSIVVRIPRVGAISFDRAQVETGQTALATIALQSPAPAGGITVNLDNSIPAALACPATVSVPAGATRVSVTVTGQLVPADMTAKVTATPTFSEKSATILVKHGAVLSTLTLQDASISTFGSTIGSLSLTAPAPAGGVSIALSANSNRLTLPATVTVPEGETSVTFVVESGALPHPSIVIQASGSGVTRTASVAIIRSSIATVTAPETVVAGNSVVMTVTLSGVAPASGVTVMLNSDAQSVVTMPASVVIPAGESSALVTVSTNAGKRGRINLYACLRGQGTKSARVEVTEN